MFISFLAALAGFILTGTQTVLIYLDGSGICLNEGCEVVDSLTRIPPIYFNIAGFFFFLVISFGLNRARRGSSLWKRFVSMLLLAALAAEGVLFSFQQFITEVYCTYCLIVLAIIFVCNLFLGLKQLFKGVVIFAAVVAAMACLNFASPPDREASLDDGSLARLGQAAPDRQLYLFFSSTCVYCENVIETIKENDNCAINFNPLDKIDSFSFPGATLTAAYTPTINRAYLKNLGIPGIPVLLDKRQESITLLRGESAIKDYLERNCSGSSVGQTVLPTSFPEQTSSSYSLVEPVSEEGCLISEECVEPEKSPALPQ